MEGQTDHRLISGSSTCIYIYIQCKLHIHIYIIYTLNLCLINSLYTLYMHTCNECNQKYDMSYAKLFAFTYSKHWDTTSTPQTERACLTTLPTLVSTTQGLLSPPPSHDLNQHHTALHLTTTVNINYSSA